MIAVKMALVYLTVNFFIFFVFGVLKLTNCLGFRFKADIDAGAKLRLHYMMVISIFIVSGITWLLVGHTSNQNVFEPPVKIWAAPSSKEFAKTYLDSNGNGFLSVSDNMSAKAFDGTLLSDVAQYGALLGLGILMFMFSRDLLSLKRIIKDSHRLRVVHSVKILINDRFLVPFSFWLPFRRFVVIPSSMLAIDPIFLRCSILHEIQHHRQGDTKMVYLLKLVRVLFPFNVAAHRWMNWISEIQEFACDETLIGQSKVESLQYARCLVEVADHALGQTPIPVGATGVTFLVEQKLLKQRIVKMMTAKGYLSAFKQQMFSLAIGGLLVCTLGISALGVSSVVLDQRISRSKAETLISRMSMSGE
ncbi:MAG: M56 family metallopeptidase, partial [Proteobacteria bacterium]|nr:M56 family metallopeptidase [Pseudomonadota bacterium]